MSAKLKLCSPDAFCQQKKENSNLSQSWIENVGSQKLKMTNQKGVFFEHCWWDPWYRTQKVNHSILSFNKTSQFKIDIVCYTIQTHVILHLDLIPHCSHLNSPISNTYLYTCMFYLCMHVFPQWLKLRDNLNLTDCLTECTILKKSKHL